MKISLGKIAGILALSLLLATSGRAVTLSIGDANELGFVWYGIPSGDADRTAYVNHLVGMAVGTSDSALGQSFIRSNNTFGTLATAVFASDGTGTSVDVTGGYTYLFAKYDGPNYGSEVWDISGLTGTITIAATAGGYGLSGWSLFNPGSGGGGGGGGNVPDGGTTAILVGLGLLGMGFVARRRTVA
jgi:hypothetical protein